ncbi:MAG TPA: glycosyltransferase, partial [Solirubrobacteraceae bacterium]|nr:glycosyltransferase [Solirubrobacteraceae bacterium]
MTSGGARRALFATSNGFGLGHVTRAMAIARRLPSHLEPVIFTLSEALPIVRRQGFLAEYFSSRNPGDETSAQWNLRLARRVDSLLDDYQPSVVVFDGTYPYSGMLESLRGAGVPLVWCRRGMWKAGSGRANLMFESEFELVIEPGELAASDDAGATVRGGRRVRRVPPILLCDDADLLDRDEASRRAGLDGRRLNVLMQPGWENEAFGPSAGMCLERLDRVPEAQVVVAVSPLRSRAVPLPDEVTKVATYPLASIYRAFDFSISGAGYNIFHEAVAYAVPAMFVPNAGTPLDDQVARARYAERHGLARNWEDRAAATLDGHLSVLLDPGARTEMARLA